MSCCINEGNKEWVLPASSKTKVIQDSRNDGLIGIAGILKHRPMPGVPEPFVICCCLGEIFKRSTDYNLETIPNEVGGVPKVEVVARPVIIRESSCCCIFSSRTYENDGDGPAHLHEMSGRLDSPLNAS